ncbi:hypothetical protein GQ53DRAFT_820385 [Thozetella sp. PMI_491]|nr:hypothetical protein GQ53DRAFT_820385 [Thozetella sp. PMI_491]
MSTNAPEAQESTAGEEPQASSKQRRMLSKACESCKSRKSRCNSKRPQCDTCRKKGVTCVYRERGQPGLPPGYGKVVNHRLAVLESSVEKIEQSLQAVLQHVCGGATGTIPHMQPLQLDHPAQGAAQQPQTWQQPESSPEVPLLTPSQSQCAEPLNPPLSFNGLEAGTTPSGTGLPPGEILEELVALYFEIVYPWLPLFNEQYFMENAGIPGRQTLLHGIVVLAFRHWRKELPSVEVRDAYVKASRAHILLETVDTCSLLATQALCLLAVDAIGQGPGHRAWNIMVMLNSAASQLGLARSSWPVAVEDKASLVRNEEPEDDLDIYSIEAEERRRLFWVIFALDRFSSVSHGRPGAIDMNTIRLPYPIHDQAWGQPAELEWFQVAASTTAKHTHQPTNMWHHNIDLLVFLERANELLVQPVNLSLPGHSQEWQSSFRRLDSSLTSWYENLPQEVRHPPTTFDPMWVMAHGTFHLIRIRMYIIAAFPPTTSPYLKPSSTARSRFRRAIRDISSLAASIQPHELDQLGPMFAIVLWVAARGLVLLWTTGYENTYASVPADLESLLSSLRRLAIRWPSAQRYNDLIQLIVDTKNNINGPVGLEIFNDTRRTAYGVEKSLGPLAVQRQRWVDPHSFDFFGTPMLDTGDMMLMGPWTGTRDLEASGDWL